MSTTIRELERNCTFSTEHLTISKWDESLFTTLGFAQVSHTLSPEVTRSLPPGWQNLSGEKEIAKWLHERIHESALFTIATKQHSLIGFLLLFPDSTRTGTSLRLGYILGKEFWGHGYATELIAGLVNWCTLHGSIGSIVGGVEPDNPASARVLEKNGFSVVEETPDTITYERQLPTK